MSFSIEIGHIYQDMDLDSSYINKIKISKNIINNLPIDHNDITTKLLIDDLNIKDKKWNTEEFVDFLKEHFVKIDILFFESKFAYFAEDVISKINNSFLRKESFKKDKKTCLFLQKDGVKVLLKTCYYNGEIKYSCPLLSSIWQLCRLNYYDYPEDSYFIINKNISKTKNTISILDKKYEVVEKKVNIILKLILEDVNNIKIIFI